MLDKEMLEEHYEEMRREAKEEEYHNRRMIEDFDYAIRCIAFQYDLPEASERLLKAYDELISIGYDISFTDFLDEVIL